MKKYLTIVLSLALVLPFVSCKFSSDYMFDGELATANVWAAADWNEEQVNALNQEVAAYEQEAAAAQEAEAAQEAPKILDLRANGAEREVTFTVTNDAFSGFEVEAAFNIAGGKRQVFKPESVNIIKKEGGRSFVTLKTTVTFDDNKDVCVYMATPYGEIRKGTISN